MENLPATPNPLSQQSVVSQIIAGANITIDEPSGVVTISAPGSGPGGGVLTLAGLEGTITLSSADNSITITPDGQDIGLTLGGSVVTSITAGGGLEVNDTTGDVTITNTGVTNLTDGTTSSASVITLTAGTAMSIVNSAGTFTIGNTGVTELTGGDGIGIDAQTGSVTVSNIGVVSLVPGEYINVTPGEAYAWTIDNTGVQTFNSYTGAVTISAGTGIELGGTEPDIEISNSGVTEALAGDGISVSAGTGSVTIGNTGVISLADITGAVTLSATGMTITPSGQNIDFAVTAGAVDSVNSQTGAVLIEAGDGISVTNTETPSINITNSGVLSVVAGTGITLTGDTPQNPTINVIARPYTLLGATIGGVVTNVIGIGSGNTWPATTFNLASTIQIGVPPGWVAGQSVFFDGYGYYNFASTVVSFWAIYYVTSTQPTEQSLVGVKLANDSIAAPASVAQIYLPMNLTIPPTYLEDGGTITLRVYGYVTTSGEYLSSNPLIDGRVGIVYP